jgi:hypothetical protein
MNSLNIKQLDYPNNERFVLADCFHSLGMKKLSQDIMINTKKGIIDKYLSIIVKEAHKRSNLDVLERLYFAGLIYDQGGF